MKRDLKELVFIIDKSGSMHRLTEDTIGGFNSMLGKQQAEGGDVLVTTVLFNSESELLHDRVSIENVAELSHETYSAGGSTALLDAIGQTVSRIDHIQKSLKDENRPEKTLVIITTDGQENRSREYSLDAVKRMVEERQAAGWDFLFLGANIDSIQTARSMGIPRERAANYDPSSRGEREKFAAMSDTISAYKMSKMISPAWKSGLDAGGKTADLYGFFMRNGHPIITIDGRNYVFDTGAPISFVFDRADRLLRFAGVHKQLPKNPLGMDQAELEAYVGCPLAGILGLDVLCRIDRMMLDRKRQLLLCNEPYNPYTHAIPFQLHGGMAMDMQVSIQGERVRAIVDTGARIGYIAGRLAAAGTYVETTEDYAPSFGGRIATDMYTVEIELGQQRFAHPMARMTGHLESSMALLGYEAIVGLNDFTWSQLTLDMTQRVISFG